MSIYGPSLRAKQSNLFKAIALVLVCLFIVNDIAWASDIIASPAKPYSVIARRPKADEAISKLAVQSRFKPFSDNQGLDLQNTATAAYVAREIRDLAVDGKLRPGQIERLNKKHFPEGKIEIGREIEPGTLTSGKKYALVIFDFKKEHKRVKTLLIKDYANLTSQDLEELKQFKIRNETDVSNLSSPDFEGVWFINPDPKPAAGAADIQSAAVLTTDRCLERLYERFRFFAAPASRIAGYIAVEEKSPCSEEALISRLAELAALGVIEKTAAGYRLSDWARRLYNNKRVRS